MTYRSTADRYLSPAERQAREMARREALAQSGRELEEKLRAEAPQRTAASKPGIVATLDALQVTLNNLRGAIGAAHVFDVRAVGDFLRTALVELDRAEARVVRDSGLEVRET
jgi:hypothetical protein